MSLRGGGALAILCIACAACSQSESPPSGPSIPDIDWSLPQRTAASPIAIDAGPPVAGTLKTLRDVVLEYGRDPLVPWAITHAILAIGLDVELTNGQLAVDYLFREYGVVTEAGIGFPLRTQRAGTDPNSGQPRAVDILVEPHPELIIKALVERGAKPGRKVQVGGQTFTLGDLYRNCMVRSWVEGGLVSHTNWSNNSWGLRALAGWAPAGLEWKALDGREMSVDRFTHSAMANLSSRLASRRAAMQAGGLVAESDRGLHSYSCGGAHYVDAVGYALRRGFGTDGDRAQFREDLKVIFWEYPRWLAFLDKYVKEQPDSKGMVAQQRFKWIGHFVELSFKMAALGAFEPDDAQREMMIRAVKDLVVHARRLEQAGVFAAMPRMREKNYQMYLDYIGDSAHALYGLQIATRQLKVHY